MEQNKLKVLRSLYYHPGAPTYLASLPSFYNYIRSSKKFKDKISKQDIIKFLSSQKTHNLHSQSNKHAKKTFPKVFSDNIYSRLMCDLAFFARNKHIFLVCSDILSGMIHAKFLRTKTAKATNAALLKILDEIDNNKFTVNQILSDSGTEFSNLHTILSPRRIQHIKLKTYQRAANVESAIGRIKQLYRRYQTQSGRKGIIPIMKSILSTLNKRYNRSTKCSAEEAIRQNKPGRLYKKRYGTAILKNFDLAMSNKAGKYNLGQKIRVINFTKAAEERSRFKPPLSRYSTKIFIIHKILKHNYPVSYILLDPEKDTLINRPVPERYIISAESEK